MDNIIEFKNITKRFPGTIALEDISFGIKEGEVHSIVGANGAGKSTLMNILGGQFQHDEGEVIFNGSSVVLDSPYDARKKGISIVYQELKLCNNLTIAENIFLGNEKISHFKKMNWKEMNEKTKEVLKLIKLDISPTTLLGDLTIGKKQLIEIAKAISLNSKVIIFDEPTSSLSMNDADILFENIDRLRKNGVTILFISHRMEEVFKISDKITVLRDGKYLGTYDANKIEHEEIVNLIAGKELYQELENENYVNRSFKEVALEVNGLTRDRYFNDISFKLYKGEILGIYGLQGAGRTEVIESIFGVQRKDKGEIIYFGEKVDIKSPEDAIKFGIGMVPEDRRKTGFFPNMDIKENLCSAKPDGMVKNNFVDNKTVSRITKEFIDKLNIKASSQNQMMINLSGGNQQKVIISKWLTKQPKVLLLDEVSRGIDVGAKAEIFKIMQELRDEGMSIILISSEIEEIMAECDRVIVMKSGVLTANILKSEFSKQNLLSNAM